MPISKWAERPMRSGILAGAVAAAIAAVPVAPAAARAQGAMDAEPDVEDVARTPLTDLNLAKDPIPPLLLEAAEGPYAGEGLDGCDDIGGAIAELDAILGPDLDVADGRGDAISVGRIAQSAVGSFIPFRSIVREITGAADHQRAFEAAITAGAIRRGYLKGRGEQMGCSYPARPAFARIDMDEDDSVEWSDREKTPRLASPEEAGVPGNEGPGNEGDITFVSEEVVQDTSG